MRIERHVEEHRAAARCQRARTGFNSLPIVAARFIEVNMRINQPGENVQVRQRSHFLRAQALRLVQAQQSARRRPNVHDDSRRRESRPFRRE